MPILAILKIFLEPILCFIMYFVFWLLLFALAFPFCCILFTPVVLLCACSGPGTYSAKVIAGYKGVCEGVLRFGPPPY